MKIRHITKTEAAKVRKLSSVCFDYPYDTKGMTDEAYTEYLMENPQETLHAHPECTIGAFSDNGELMAAAAAIPFSFYFDGRSYEGNGIGNVSTYPQYRRKGAVRAIFKQMLEEAYQSGSAFSYLYPFSEAFYNAFGYYRMDNSICHQYALHSLPDYSFTGSFSIKEGAHVPVAFRDVYESFAKKYNLMVKRGELDWKNLTEAKGAVNNRYAYLYTDACGQACGYLIFGKEDRIMKCRELVFDGPETLRALLSFARGFRADYDHICFYAPACLNLSCLCPDFMQGNSFRAYADNGMVRVIHVKKVLYGAHYLKDGLARIAVSDPWIADNHAIFTVVIREGRAVHIETDPIMTGREPGSCDFDIWMPISVFSAAITGNFSLGDFDFMENVTYDETKAELLAGIFYRKDCFINNYF